MINPYNTTPLTTFLKNLNYMEDNRLAYFVSVAQEFKKPYAIHGNKVYTKCSDCGFSRRMDRMGMDPVQRHFTCLWCTHMRIDFIKNKKPLK